MKKQDIEDITSFLDEEISDYDLEYDYEIEDEGDMVKKKIPKKRIGYGPRNIDFRHVC